MWDEKIWKHRAKKVRISKWNVCGVVKTETVNICCVKLGGKIIISILHA